MAEKSCIALPQYTSIKKLADSYDQKGIRHSVVNMSKSCCFVFMLAVICLPVILLSLEADAQPTIDETTSCRSSTLEDVVVKIKDEIREVKKLLASVVREYFLRLVLTPN